MANRVFFSFHYDDVESFRANVVRKHGLTKPGLEAAGFIDASIWEEAERHGPESVKRLINDHLKGTSVSCVLIGTHTWSRRWVRYEIFKSYDRGNRLFGVHINSIKDKTQTVLPLGTNPFENLGFTISADGQTTKYYVLHTGKWIEYTDLSPQNASGRFDRQYWGKGFNLSHWVPIYDWVSGDGYNNFSTWVDNAK